MRRVGEQKIRSQSKKIEQLKMLQEIQKILRYKPNARLYGRVSKLDEDMQIKKDIVMRHLKQAKIIGGLVGSATGVLGGGTAGAATGAGSGALIGAGLGACGGFFAPLTVPLGATVGAIVGGIGGGVAGLAGGGIGMGAAGISIAKKKAFKNAWNEILELERQEEKSQELDVEFDLARASSIDREDIQVSDKFSLGISDNDDTDNADLFDPSRNL